jgi:replicative DNA helicase
MELSNVASERAVLAGICAHGPDCYLDVEPFLEEGTFTVDFNKVMYKCIKEIINTSDRVDFVSLLSAATDLSLGEYVNRPDVLKHFHGVLATPVDLSVVSGHAKKIRRLQFARHLQETIKESYKDLNEISGEESLSHIVSIIENPVQNASTSYLKKDENKPKRLGEDGIAYFEHLMSDEPKQVGISSGFPSYDAAIGGGFLRKCVDLVGARTKGGKSVFCDNVALHVSNANIPVLVLDTEMCQEDHWNRLWANMTGIPINEIKTGDFKTDKLKVSAVAEARDKLASIPYFYINVSGKGFDEILSIARRWVLREVGYENNGRTKDCLIIYDYFKLMDASSISDNMAEFQAMGFQATKLHNFCVEYDVPCLSFVQLNRDGIDKESADVISQSDRIGWLCTSFTILKQKSVDEIADDGPKNGNRKLVPVLSRHGPGMTDEGYICLDMRGELARMREIGTVRRLSRSKEFPERTPDSESEDESEDT